MQFMYYFASTHKLMLHTWYYIVTSWSYKLILQVTCYLLLNVTYMLHFTYYKLMLHTWYYIHPTSRVYILYFLNEIFTHKRKQWKLIISFYSNLTICRKDVTRDDFFLYRNAKIHIRQIFVKLFISLTWILKIKLLTWRFWLQHD